MTLPKQYKICTWKDDCLNNNIRSGTMANSDGITYSCQLYQPTGICLELDNVLYFTNYRTASVKIASILSHTGTFLETNEKFMKAIFDILFQCL